MYVAHSRVSAVHSAVSDVQLAVSTVHFAVAAFAVPTVGTASSRADGLQNVENCKLSPGQFANLQIVRGTICKGLQR